MLFVHTSVLSNTEQAFNLLFFPPLTFCFLSHPGVILPHETHQIEVIFKSNNAGFRTELWQLHTHPVLMQGAPIQFGLTGVSLCKDKTADLRLLLEVTLLLDCI